MQCYMKEIYGNIVSGRDGLIVIKFLPLLQRSIFLRFQYRDFFGCSIQASSKNSLNYNQPRGLTAHSDF